MPVEDAIKAWLTTHWRSTKACPICTENRWSVSGDLVSLPCRQGDRLYPMVSVTCGVCGYVLWFNAVVAGFVDPQEVSSHASA